MAKVKQEPKGKRQGNKPWKGIYGVDRKYTARVDRAVDRGQYTEPEKNDAP
jgi:hypothetical protein